jgi:hypothetical protein
LGFFFIFQPEFDQPVTEKYKKKVETEPNKDFSYISHGILCFLAVSGRITEIGLIPSQKII